MAKSNCQLSFALKLNRITEVWPLTVSRTIAKPIVGWRSILRNQANQKLLNVGYSGQEIGI